MTGSALIIIDMINTYEHQDAELLLPAAEAALPGIVSLLDRARAAGAPVIYANDNWGQWRSHHGELLDHALSKPHAALVEPLRPDADSLFIVKARHSIFYETPLTYLLGQLGVHQLVLTGQVTEQCILYSALDAHIRHLGVTVPADAVAAIHPELAEAALSMMGRNMDADITQAAEVVW
ncbi:isochorismatase family cysteine hydrolase [Streptomyces sp. NBC_01012]|uniref:isochorismatase family cysteine hydrolase n=1 Tax=Streptomyces sp. NBC_01012 TaxID=2903717 RepID=UPI00386ECBCD|nr:cysteine hydrolase [Streptomyces sp. NBC_01012]